jgi:hypothetical protein
VLLLLVVVLVVDNNNVFFKAIAERGSGTVKSMKQFKELIALTEKGMLQIAKSLDTAARNFGIDMDCFLPRASPPNTVPTMEDLLCRHTVTLLADEEGRQTFS